jgi:hypothetical protein
MSRRSFAARFSAALRPKAEIQAEAPPRHDMNKIGIYAVLPGVEEMIGTLLGESRDPLISCFWRSLRAEKSQRKSGG